MFTPFHSEKSTSGASYKVFVFNAELRPWPQLWHHVVTVDSGHGLQVTSNQKVCFGWYIEICVES